MPFLELSDNEKIETDTFSLEKLHTPIDREKVSEENYQSIMEPIKNAKK